VSASIPDAVKERVRQQAGNRCGYCRARQEYVLWFLEIDHIIPMARGGTDDEDNL
jgi:5-methylcytosine-specific restriction endonuclease McrA